MEPTRTVHVSLMHHDPTSTITTTLVGTVGSIGSRRRVFVTRRHGLLSFHFSKALKVDLQRLHVVLEAQSRHRPKKIVAVDRLSLFALALVGGLAGDEADEFRHTLLNRLLRVLRDLCVRRKRLLHDATHVCDRQKPVLLPRRHLAALAGVVRAAGVVVGVRHR
ncbi:hypothetical protein VIGAN_05201100 [Vigna angularis var. angularis]|uniref:Uncharacterized protein n=1 Tax=Vigna angularis var. angularis TaxID=157739 RepID=A0A0S3S6P4_PHAAN|nr:hypothetical protein VIGAN_05201100 [Vigna angularis var. angularis]